MSKLQIVRLNGSVAAVQRPGGCPAETLADIAIFRELAPDVVAAPRIEADAAWYLPSRHHDWDRSASSLREWSPESPNCVPDGGSFKNKPDC